MSDSMERDKTELMIRKEKEEEEEEMKRELEAMQMYESWYTYTDMKQILGAINESRDMANMTNDERKKLTHCSNNWIPEATSKSQTQELEAQDHNDASQSMHSYRIIRTSPVHERVPCQGCSTSNVASTVDDFGNPAFRRKFLDNEDTSIHRSQDNSNTRDCYYHTPNRSLSLNRQKRKSNSTQELYISKRRIEKCRITSCKYLCKLVAESGRYYNYSDIELELTTENVALFVWMEAGNICGRFSENGFHMFESRKRIVFFACESITPKMFSHSLNVTTLSDIY